MRKLAAFKMRTQARSAAFLFLLASSPYTISSALSCPQSRAKLDLVARAQAPVQTLSMGNSSHATFPSLAKASGTAQAQRLDDASSSDDDDGPPPSPQDLALAEAFNTPDWDKLVPGAAQAAEAWATAQQVGQPPLTTVSGSEAAMREASSIGSDNADFPRQLKATGTTDSATTEPRQSLHLRSHNKKKAHKKARLRKNQKGATHSQRSKLSGKDKVRQSMTDTSQLLTANGMLTWYAGGQLLNPVSLLSFSFDVNGS